MSLEYFFLHILYHIFNYHVFYLSLKCVIEPQSFEEAIEMKGKEKWLQTMNEEIQSSKENQTYVMMELPKGPKAL